MTSTMETPREYFIKIAPFEYYGAAYYAARERVNSAGHANLNYFKDTPDEETAHTFEEARETYKYLKASHPGRKIATISRQELKTHTFETPEEFSHISLKFI